MRKFIGALLCLFVILGAIPAFADECYENDFFRYNANGEILLYFGDEVVNVPAEIDGTPIVKIGDQAFFDIGIDTVYTAEGIKTIGKSAFQGCNVSYIDIAKSITSVEEMAFADCSCLTDVVLNSDIVQFGEDAFRRTGYLMFTVPCTADREKLNREITKAKGDTNFGFTVMHPALLESETTKGLLFCENCGYACMATADEDYVVTFYDVPPESWYYTYVALSQKLGILNGRNEAIFDPDADMTLAEAAKIAASLHSLLTGEELPLVDAEKWYQPYVDYCAKMEIITDADQFNWEQKATRGEMAYLFCRADNFAIYPNNVPLTDIPDVDEITAYYGEIWELYNRGIAVGDENMAFYPQSFIKRSEVAALIAREVYHELRVELPKG